MLHNLKIEDTMTLLIEQMNLLSSKLDNTEQSNRLSQDWYSLREACKLKGVNYNTIKKHPELQPNKGKNRKKVGCIYKWCKADILKWLSQTDDDV